MSKRCHWWLRNGVRVHRVRQPDFWRTLRTRHTRAPSQSAYPPHRSPALHYHNWNAVTPTSYVPGFSSDLFISYAHGDDPDWLRGFEQALAREVRSRLGCEIRVWQDIKRLRAGSDWPEEIKQAVASAAVFLAVLSPSYQNSQWCLRELNTFLGLEGKLDAVKAGDVFRLLKAVKIPWENDDHTRFLTRAQHVEFFRRLDDAREFLELSGPDYNDAVRNLAASVAFLLKTMRRQLQKVYVASPCDDVLPAWDRLRNQLTADRYNVSPTARLSSAYEDAVITREVESAVVTVHLLGSDYDAFAEHQFKLAAEMGARQLVWFSPVTGDRSGVAPKQWDLLDAIRKNNGLNPKLDWFTGSVQEMIVQVQNALKPKPPDPPPLDETAPARVYLIHDATTRPDAEFAATLQAQLRQAERFQVLFPPSGTTAPDVQERHRQQLQTCEGVLLYRNQAPETWLDQYVGDVLYPGRKARAKSKAFLLDDPTLLDGATLPVIARKPDFKLADLEPFLRPLRETAVAGA